ncbi:MAG: SDR family oxidoreductase [Pseudomonadales bacterium]|nr:SDR family oxidoreductase [Pseudomonadales bacterium]
MATVLITGCNRGIGLELVRQSLQRGGRDGRGDKVIAACRDPDSAEALTALQADFSTLDIMALDVGVGESIAEFSRALEGKPIDVFINNAGIYGQRDAHLGDVDADAWHRAFQINTIGPLMLTQRLMPNLRKGRGRRLFYMSSQMGSIADNNSGGSYVYRSTKTALNQVVKSLAMDLAGEGFVVVALHPGWVITDMGGPNALITTRTSVEGMLSVIASAGPEQNGQFLNYDGKVIPY